MKDTYKCEVCGKTIEATGEDIPECCNKKMTRIPIDICTQPAHPENARPMDDEDVCDDGRAG